MPQQRARRARPRRSLPATAALLLVLIAAGAAPRARAAAYRLLFYPLGERTHMMVHLELATELAARGHDVHFATPDCHQPFAEARAAARRPRAPPLSFVSYPLDCAWVEEDKKRAAVAGQLHGIWMIVEALANRTDYVLGHEGFMGKLRALRDSPGGIDLVIADPLAFGALLPMSLGLPFIDFDVGTAGSLYEPIFYGAQSAPAYVPSVGTFFPTDGMNLLQKAANLLASFAARRLIEAVYFHPAMWVQRIIQKHGIPLRWPYTNPLLELVNSNFVTEPPRPVGPVTKYIGPILPEPAGQLPADLDAWVSGAGPLGAVLVSFGGTLAAPPASSRTVLRAAGALPDARFVWKLSEAEQAALQDDIIAANLTNLKVMAWVPQNDLLGHPNLRAFVTQGGFLSVGEAAYHGVPIVGLPMIAGQGELIRFAADQGRGVMLRKSVLTRGDAPRFAAAIRAVLTDPSFARAARLASERLRAARAPYRSQAADWVEYAAALRNHGSFLHTQGQRMKWWQVACLDVVGVLLAVAALPAWWLYTVWAAGRGGGGGIVGGGGADGLESVPPARLDEQASELVQVQLMFPPSQQAAAKQLQLQAKQLRQGGLAVLAGGAGKRQQQQAPAGGAQQEAQCLQRRGSRPDGAAACCSGPHLGGACCSLLSAVQQGQHSKAE